MSKSYITTHEFCEAMGWDLKVPSRVNGLPPEAEQLSLSNGKYYFAFENILDNTYSLYYGATSSSLTALIPVTDFTINLADGYIELTSAGQSKVDTDNIYGTYRYVSLGLSDEYIAKAIQRASSKVDAICNTTFIDGTEPNPQYEVRNLVLRNQGFWNRHYYFEDLPLVNLTSELANSMDTTTTTLTLKTGDGVEFPLTGKICVGNEIMSYSLSGDVMTVVRGETPQEHSVGDIVSTICIEISAVLEGYPVINYPQNMGFVTLEYGRDFASQGYNNIYIYETSRTFRVRFETPARVKITHLWGYQTIPDDIKRLTLLLTKRQLASDNIMKAMIEGRNEFNPEMFNVDEQEMNSIISAYKILRMGNT